MQKMIKAPHIEDRVLRWQIYNTLNTQAEKDIMMDLYWEKIQASKCVTRRNITYRAVIELIEKVIEYEAIIKLN